MNEKISVIIPLYNKEHEIKRTLDSVLGQTYQNFEIIVVDDKSSDKGPAIVQNYNELRIKLIEQDHRGVSHTRNHGVDLATSDFIAFLDADDEWMPNYLNTILRLIQKYPEAGMFTTAMKMQIADGTSIFANYKCIPNSPWEGIIPDYFKSGAFGESPVNSSDVVIPRKIFHEMGGFLEDYWFGEDVDLFGKIALKYSVAFSWEFGAIYHMDASNRVSSGKLPLDYEEPFVKTARTALTKGEVPQKLIESVNEYICRKEIIRAFRNVLAGHSDKAQTILKQCNTKWFYKQKIKWLLLAKLPYPLNHLFMRDTRQKLFKKIQNQLFRNEH